MKTSSSNFPISGDACSGVFNAAAALDKKWVLTNIETLSEVPAKALGDLWRQVRNGPVTVTTSDLCAALCNFRLFPPSPRPSLSFLVKKKIFHQRSKNKTNYCTLYFFTLP